MVPMRQVTDLQRNQSCQKTVLLYFRRPSIADYKNPERDVYWRHHRFHHDYLNLHPTFWSLLVNFQIEKNPQCHWMVQPEQLAKDVGCIPLDIFSHNLNISHAQLFSILRYQTLVGRQIH